jgi:hypothetical protein
VFLGVQKHAAKNYANDTFHHATTIKKHASAPHFSKTTLKNPSKIAENHSSTSGKFYFANLAFF